MTQDRAPGLTAEQQACANTDKELWRERDGDYYADSIHATERGSIGIDCGGMVFVMPVKDWHRLAVQEALRECPGYEPSPDSPVCQHCGMTRNLHDASPALPERQGEDVSLSRVSCAEIKEGTGEVDWISVPREPSEQMLYNGVFSIQRGKVMVYEVRQIYKTMISAAPQTAKEPS